MGMIKINLEELEVDRAVEAEQKKDSTDSKDIAVVANYREELEKLRSQNPKEGNDDSESATDKPSGVATNDNAGDENPAKTTDNSSTGEDTNDQDDAKSTDTVPKETVEGEKIEPTSDNIAQLDEAVECMTAIGDIRQILFDSQTKGGVTPQTARVAQECVSHLAGRIGFASKTSIGAEDFDSVSTRMRSTEIAIEDFTDTMKRIWEGIKKFFAAMYNWIKEFLFGKKAKMKDAQEQLTETKKNAEDLKKKGELSEEAKQRIRIQFYRNKSRYLITTNGDLRIEEALEHSATFKQFFMQYADTFRAFALRQAPILTEFGKQLPDADVIGKFYIDEDFLRKMKLKAAKRTDFVALHPNNTLLSSEVLPGGMQMTFNILKSGQLPGPESIKQNSIKLVSAYSGDTIRGGVEMIVDNNDIGTIIKEIEALRKLETNAFELMIDNFKHVEDKYKQLIGTIPSRWGNVDPKLFSLFTSLLTNVQRYTTTMFHKGNQDMLTLFGNHTDALNDYVNACIRACSMAVLAKTN